ncbi:hypothetical protein HYQ45_018589 [Verticillium longisporum]|uniref:Uncharacterized protein n=1 Tax=Verticillium longisporum TaxID=100787 RepID=A0A8I3AHC4_VERLO|nr:hypothetical protein HYQ45_018589 [Verticillium longisporum]KAG7123865.1 hypothetical protein HYQ44_002501 [Verticillium longisporum]KAG7148410.1 hypothetical protein HYQ46_002727 [Verticillium longisporum]
MPQDSTRKQLDPRSATFTPGRSMSAHLDTVYDATTHGANVEELTKIPDAPVPAYFVPGQVVYVTAPYLCVERADGPSLEPLHNDMSLPKDGSTKPPGSSGINSDQKPQMRSVDASLGSRENSHPSAFVRAATGSVSSPWDPHWPSQSFQQHGKQPEERPATPDGVTFEDDHVFLRGSDLENSEH